MTKTARNEFVTFVTSWYIKVQKKLLASKLLAFQPLHLCVLAWKTICRHARIKIHSLVLCHSKVVGTPERESPRRKRGSRERERKRRRWRFFTSSLLHPSFSLPPPPSWPPPSVTKIHPLLTHTIITQQATQPPAPRLAAVTLRYILAHPKRGGSLPQQSLLPPPCIRASPLLIRTYIPRFSRGGRPLAPHTVSPYPPPPPLHRVESPPTHERTSVVD